MLDELRAIERDAREQGEADARREHWRTLFSAPQPTIEAAQALHTYELFNCAAVLQTPDGTFVYGLLREMDSPPHRSAQAVEAACGYKMVAYHGALLPVWQEYHEETQR